VERNDLPNPARFLEANLERGNLLLLFDGLDEVNPGQREKDENRNEMLLNHFHGLSGPYWSKRKPMIASMPTTMANA
jgi:hypothetical protein